MSDLLPAPPRFGRQLIAAAASHAPAALVAGGGIAAAVLFLLSWSHPDEAQTLRVAGMLSIAIALYASGALPGYVTSLLMFLIAAVGGLAPLPVVFSGFASGAVWLLMAGTIIGIAASATELGPLIAERLTTRVRLTYARAILLLVSVSTLLGFLVPAALPRIIILMPLVTGLADAMGFERAGRGYTGLAIAVAGGSFYPTLSVLTATLPAIVFAGNTETVHGLAPSYSDFLLYQLPVIGVLRWAGLTALLILFFREPPTPPMTRPETKQPAPRQRRLMLILFALLALWMTDGIHHIAPAWVALGVALVVLLPGLGVLDHREFARQADLTPLVYVAGIVSLGAIVTSSRLDEIIGALLAERFHFAEGAMFANYLGIALISGLASMLVTAPAAPTLLVPLAQQLSESAGLGLSATLMTQYAGLTTVLLPYQAPPLVIAMGLFGISASSVVRVAVFLFLLTVLLILPINFLWWRIAGLLP